MKKLAIAVGLAVALCAISVQAQRSAPKPTPEMEPLGIWIGTWTIDEEVKDNQEDAAYQQTWTLQFRWIVDGQFMQVLHTWKSKKGEITAVETTAYDSTRKLYLSAGVSNKGNRWIGSATLRERVFTISNSTMRNTFTFSADGKSLTLKRERQTAGTWWTSGTGKGIKGK